MSLEFRGSHLPIQKCTCYNEGNTLKIVVEHEHTYTREPFNGFNMLRNFKPICRELWSTQSTRTCKHPNGIHYLVLNLS